MTRPSKFGPTMGGAGWAAASRGTDAGRENSAIADLTQCTVLDPNNSTAWAVARRDPWATSIAGAKRRNLTITGRQLGGDAGPIPWYYHAALRLYANDEPGYRHACQTMMERFGSTTDAFRRIAGGPCVRPRGRSWSFPRPRRRPRPAGRPRQASRRLVELYPGVRPPPGRPPGRGAGHVRNGSPRRPGLDRHAADHRAT